MTHPLIPLLILTVLLSVGAFIGYTIYTIANDVAQKTAKKMEQKNVSFSKDGLRVGVKEVQTENYVAKTQRYCLTPSPHPLPPPRAPCISAETESTPPPPSKIEVGKEETRSAKANNFPSSLSTVSSSTSGTHQPGPPTSPASAGTKNDHRSNTSVGQRTYFLPANLGMENRIPFSFSSQARFFILPYLTVRSLSSMVGEGRVGRRKRRFTMTNMKSRSGVVISVHVLLAYFVPFPRFQCAM